MPEILQNGTPVRLVQPIIQGEVKEARIIDGTIQYMVGFTDENGETHERFFRANELEVIAP